MTRMSACDLPTELLIEISSYLTWVELSNWVRLNREHEKCISPVLYHWLTPYDHKPKAEEPQSVQNKRPPKPYDKSRCLILTWAASKGHPGTIKKIVASEDIGQRINRPILKNGELGKAGCFGMTVMHTAALNGNAKVIDYLVELGADINATVAGRIRPIHVARTGEVVRTLVRHGSPLKPQGIFSISPLTYALSTNCKPDATKCFLELGCNPNARSLIGLTPGEEAIRRGDIQSLKLLLDAGLRVSESASVEGSWIYKAIEYLQSTSNATITLHIVQLLIKYGAPAHGGKLLIGHQPWAVQYFQSNLFLAACMPSSTDLVQVLLHHGARVNEQSWRERKEVDAARQRMNVYFDPETPLQRLILSAAKVSESEAESKIDTFRVLARYGAKVDLRSYPNFLNDLLAIKPLTPGLVKIVLFLTGLLTQDPREPNYLVEPILKSPIGPIHAFLAPDSAWFMPRSRYTSPATSLKIFKRLLELGGDVNTPDSHGNPPLRLACMAPLEVNSLKYIRILEAYGVDMNFGSKEGQNALHTTLRGLGGLREEHRNRFQAILMGPLGSQVDVNARDRDTGLTPLAFLAKMKLPVLDRVRLRMTSGYGAAAAPPQQLRILMARMLLRRGADVNIRQEFSNPENGPRDPLSGGTVLHYACDSGDKELLELLLDHCTHPDLNSFTEDGYTPLMVLVRSGIRRDINRQDLITIKDRLIKAGADPKIRNWEGKAAWDLWVSEGTGPQWFWESLFGDLHISEQESVPSVPN